MATLTSSFVFILSTTAVVLSFFGSAQGTGYSFQREPEEYYYAFENTAVTIPCEGIETRDDGTEQLIDVVIFKNSERINSDDPPTGLLPLSHQNHITGILLVPVTRVDSGSTYQCVIEVNGEVVLSSRQTILYVGDGRPIAPVSNPVQTGETLTTITITWGKSPVPSNSPLEGYTIVLSPTEGGGQPLEVETTDNETTIELFRLVPGGEYQIKVFGRNSNGAGPRSGSVVARTVVPEAPYSPSLVEGVLETFETNSSIKVTWTLSEIDTEGMTPVNNYIIFYGTVKRGSPLSSYQNVSTLDNTTAMYILSALIISGNYTVGVAAVNSAGLSPVTFYDGYFEIHAPEATTTVQIDSSMTTSTGVAMTAALSAEIIISIGVVCTSLLLVLTITIIIAMIIYIRRKTKEMTVNLNETDGSREFNNSPSSNRKGHASPKTNSSPRHSNGHSNGHSIQLNDYEIEPRRAGSPAVTDFDASVKTVGSLCTSTFVDSSFKA